MEKWGAHFENKVVLNLKNPWDPTQNPSPSVPYQQPLPAASAAAAAGLMIQLH